MKILKLAILLFMYISFSRDTYAISIPVEQVFSDVNKNYRYYNELQDLYNKGMIFPDSNGKLNPQKLLSRDEFVGIAVETSCTKCISPNTDVKLLQKYIDKPFFDVQNTNKYKYCISYAKDNSFVAGYDINHKCIDGTYKKNQNPFCTNNNISLEESLAVILRMSGILSSSEAESIRQQIRSGGDFPVLALDVKPKNKDGSVYSFYPDFSKALSYEIIDYDTYGNKEVYKLLEKTGDYLRPDRYITKEEFLLLAYKALKANSCIEKQENNLALKMEIFDKKCNLGDKKCHISDLRDPTNTYDLNANVDGICAKGINPETGYIWRFYNENTGEEFKRYGKYIDNYKFLKEGKWTVFLRVIDNCQNTAEVQSIIDTRKKTQNNNGLGLDVTADKIYGTGPLTTTFISKVDGGTGPYTYKWDFGDGTTGSGKDTKHIFSSPGIYEVKTIVTDKNGQTSEVTTVIKVVSKTQNNNGLGLDVTADKIYGTGPLTTTFISKVDGGTGPYTYKWDFGDGTTGSGKDTKHIFSSPGIYEVKTIVTDKNGQTSEVTTVIKVVSKTQNNNTLSVSIKANPIYGNGPLESHFESIIGGNSWPYTYKWDFGDGNTSYEKNPIHIFKQKGVYEVLLYVTDNFGNISKASVIIYVTNSIDCTKDSDNDGIGDCDDKCPLIKGSSVNSGCPVFEQKCNSNCGCKKGYICSSIDKNTCTKDAYCVAKADDLGSCISSLQNTGFIYGNAICESCPCENYFDFKSVLKTCDSVFPAITSPDEKVIYGKGDLFQIK